MAVGLEVLKEIGGKFCARGRETEDPRPAPAELSPLGWSHRDLNYT